MNRTTLPLSLLLVLPLVLPVQAQDKNHQPSRTLGMVALAAHPAVHKELKLDEKQAAALKQAAEESRKSARAAQQIEDKAARRKENNKANQKLRGVISKTLNEEQQKRLLQIELQTSSGAWIIRRTEVSKMLELTKEQRKEILELAQKLRKTTEQLRATQNDNNRQEIQKKIAAGLAESRKMAMKLLTEEQQKKWKKALGEPFQLRNRRAKKKE